MKKVINGVLLDTDNSMLIGGISYLGSVKSETRFYMTNDKKYFFYVVNRRCFSDELNCIYEDVEFEFTTEEEIIKFIEDVDDRSVCSISNYIERGAREEIGLNKIGKSTVDYKVFYMEYNYQLADWIYEQSSFEYKDIFNILRLEKNYELHSNEIEKQYVGSDVVDQYICDSLDLSPEIMKQFRQDEENYYISNAMEEKILANCPEINLDTYSSRGQASGIPF